MLVGGTLSLLSSGGLVLRHQLLGFQHRDLSWGCGIHSRAPAPRRTSARDLGCGEGMVNVAASSQGGPKVTLTSWFSHPCVVSRVQSELSCNADRTWWRG